MILKIQIYSLLFSFGYGVFFFYFLELWYKLLIKLKLILQIILSFVFVIMNSLLYFFLLKKINNGILHLYFFLSLLTGYILSNIAYRKLIVNKK